MYRIFEDVDDATLRWLYEHAALYISPSLFEGFSMTPFESLLCDCPILLSDIPVHREVYGEGFHYFNPRDAAGLKEMIGESLSRNIEKNVWPCGRALSRSTPGLVFWRRIWNFTVRR